jgi:hypothetical protein
MATVERGTETLKSSGKYTVSGSQAGRLYVIKMCVLTLVVAKLAMSGYMQYKSIVALRNYPSRFDPSSEEAAELIQQCGAIQRAASIAATAQETLEMYGDLTISCGPISGPPCGRTCCSACEEQDLACQGNCTEASPTALTCCPSDAETLKRNFILYVVLSSTETLLSILLGWQLMYYAWKRYKVFVKERHEEPTCERVFKAGVHRLRGYLLHQAQGEKQKLKHWLKQIQKKGKAEAMKMAQNMGEEGKVDFEYFVDTVLSTCNIENIESGVRDYIEAGSTSLTLEDIVEKISIDDEAQKPPFVPFVLSTIITALFEIGCLAYVVLLFAQMDGSLLCLSCPERQKWKDAAGALVDVTRALLVLGGSLASTITAGAVVYIFVPLSDGNSQMSLEVTQVLSWSIKRPRTPTPSPSPSPSPSSSSSSSSSPSLASTSSKSTPRAEPPLIKKTGPAPHTPTPTPTLPAPAITIKPVPNPTPTPTPTPKPTPPAVVSEEPTPTPTPISTPIPTPIPTPAPTPIPTPTPTPIPTPPAPGPVISEEEPTPTPTPMPTPTPTPNEGDQRRSSIAARPASATPYARADVESKRGEYRVKRAIFIAHDETCGRTLSEVKNVSVRELLARTTTRRVAPEEVREPVVEAMIEQQELDTSVSTASKPGLFTRTWRRVVSRQRAIAMSIFNSQAPQAGQQAASSNSTTFSDLVRESNFDLP